jgi:hypothetical protein
MILQAIIFLQPMFIDLKKQYDSAIKDLELEISELENKILENEFNVELMKNNAIIEDKDKEDHSLKYTLKYNKQDFTPIAPLPQPITLTNTPITSSNDLSDTNNKGE